VLKNPVLRKTVGKAAALAQAAVIGGVSLDELMKKIAEKIKDETGNSPDVDTDASSVEAVKDEAARHELLKEIIKDLHTGGDFEDAKRRFGALIEDVDATEIAAMEQRLISDGMPETEVKRLCDVHVKVFQESLERKNTPSTPEGHPVHTFMAENRVCENLTAKIEAVLGEIGTPPKPEVFRSYARNLEKLTDALLKIDLHFLRKENQLFPVLEKHGVTGPSRVMWSLDDDIRAMLKKAKALLETGDAIAFVPSVRQAIQTIKDMIYKEERILFPMALDTLSEEEWETVKHGESELGYAWIEPVPVPSGVAGSSASPPQPASVPPASAFLPFDTGRMTLDQVNLLLKHLPLDVSYVDEKDEVAYYSDTKERIFPRSAGVIGRKVENCHPPKSVHVVRKILDDFRAGKRDSAEFWIRMKDRFVHIRYFAVRDAAGAYRGCLEVTQDVTDIRNLQGERRLLE
jgi:DUF438 domain-containing protein